MKEVEAEEVKGKRPARKAGPRKQSAKVPAVKVEAVEAEAEASKVKTAPRPEASPEAGGGTPPIKDDPGQMSWIEGVIP